MFPTKVIPGFLLFCLLLKSFDLSANESAGSSLVLSIQGKVLTASINNASLPAVLEALNRQNPQSIVITGVIVAADEFPKVSAELKNVPLLQGIRRLLKNQDYMLAHSEGDNGDKKPGIFLKARRQSQETVIPIELQTTSLAPTRNDSDARSFLLEQLADLSDLAQLESVLPTAVQDPDSIVREHALKSLTLMFDNAPRHLLAVLALSDPLPKLRAETLEVLADRRENWAIDILHEATADDDPSVSQLASTLLDRISLLSEE